jgi:hypothetical protein
MIAKRGSKSFPRKIIKILFESRKESIVKHQRKMQKDSGDQNFQKIEPKFNHIQ